MLRGLKNRLRNVAFFRLLLHSFTVLLISERETQNCVLSVLQRTKSAHSSLSAGSLAGRLTKGPALTNRKEQEGIVYPFEDKCATVWQRRANNEISWEGNQSEH